MNSKIEKKNSLYLCRAQNSASLDTNISPVAQKNVGVAFFRRCKSETFQDSDFSAGIP